MWSRPSSRSLIAERRLDADRQTALEALPARIRPAFEALWDLDLALADVVSTSSDPRLGQIRLAWWRDRLIELDHGKAPGEPRLQAAQRELVGGGLATGDELSGLAGAWSPMLDPFPWGADQVDAFRRRGALLFGIGANLLGARGEAGRCAGETWSLSDGAIHCSDTTSRALLLDAARQSRDNLPQRADRAVRPLTLLGALALHDLDPRGPFGRGGAALRHRLIGRF